MNAGLSYFSASVQTSAEIEDAVAIYSVRKRQQWAFICATLRFRTKKSVAVATLSRKKHPAGAATLSRKKKYAAAVALTLRFRTKNIKN
jgi:hypothetical protein